MSSISDFKSATSSKWNQILHVIHHKTSIHFIIALLSLLSFWVDCFELTVQCLRFKYIWISTNRHAETNTNYLFARNKGIICWKDSHFHVITQKMHAHATTWLNKENTERNADAIINQTMYETDQWHSKFNNFFILLFIKNVKYLLFCYGNFVFPKWTQEKKLLFTQHKEIMNPSLWGNYSFIQT